MEILPILQNLGLPGWLVSIAALIVILHYTGIVHWAGETLRDRQEHRQERDELEWESRAQARAESALRQREIDNAALAIARENIKWAREDFSIMQKTIEFQGRILEQLRNEIRILAGAIARLADTLERGE